MLFKSGKSSGVVTVVSFGNAKKPEPIPEPEIGIDLTYIIKGKPFKRQYSNYKNIKDKVDYRIRGAGSKKYLWIHDQM